jgi:uncharacterized protein YbaA (DUF1428 family)
MQSMADCGYESRMATPRQRPGMGLSLSVAPRMPNHAGNSTEEIPMPRYIDGYVIPIKKTRLAAYRRLATTAGQVWMDHGALAFLECAGEDLKTKFGGSFLKLAKAKPGETVLYSFVIYKSRRDRDRINAKVAKDPRLAAIMRPGAPMPFDMKRVTYGGFSALVDL